MDPTKRPTARQAATPSLLDYTTRNIRFHSRHGAHSSAEQWPLPCLAGWLSAKSSHGTPRPASQPSPPLRPRVMRHNFHFLYYTLPCLPKLYCDVIFGNLPINYNIIIWPRKMYLRNSDPPTRPRPPKRQLFSDRMNDDYTVSFWYLIAVMGSVWQVITTTGLRG